MGNDLHCSKRKKAQHASYLSITDSVPQSLHQTLLTGTILNWVRSKYPGSMARLLKIEIRGGIKYNATLKAYQSKNTVSRNYYHSLTSLQTRMSKPYRSTSQNNSWILLLNHGASRFRPDYTVITHGKGYVEARYIIYPDQISSGTKMLSSSKAMYPPN